MKKKEYHINIHSINRFIISFTIFIFLYSSLPKEYMLRSENEVFNILQFLCVYTILAILANLIGTAKVKIVLTEEGILHVWKRRYFLSWAKSFKIPWDLVDNYIFHEDRTFDSLIINLKNKTRHKINRQNFIPIKDDFDRLINDFPKVSNQFKGSSSLRKDIIKEGESFYTSKHFKWVFYVFSALFILLLFNKIINPQSELKWSPLIIIGSGLSFYYIQMLLKKKK